MSAGGEHLKDEGNRTQVIAAGAIAGLISRFCIAPLDVVKIRLQLQVHSLSDPTAPPSRILSANPVYKGTFSTFRTIVRDEGITGLWKGNIPAELLYVTYGALQFTTYRTLTLLLQSLPPSSRLPSTVESFISGAGAGAVATLTTYPLDLLRTRFAAQSTTRVYATLAQSIRQITLNEGLRGWFRGSGAALGQIVPYMGLFFTTYELARLPLRDLHLPFGSGDAVAGIMASVLAKTGVFPLDLIRKRLQVQGPMRERFAGGRIPEYTGGVIGTMKQILKTQGVRGLYRGLGIGLVKAAPASAVTMWTYERALGVLKDRRFGETD
ncbi:hypothetical protein AJ80_07743 [Polytolypa hystricis UAMH7299]|uniref:Mitochondrial thiamine pyrophosphate carrier 1 n=1 Tax=Polytolypa hystricis (strain UAMH7299) TaxID=1447883 RepID=A0A2B7XJA0_POLH7|nr:hypothetical protein AJ80_07743 [Polytolypa hystricis UAMH7299]